MASLEDPHTPRKIFYEQQPPEQVCIAQDVPLYVSNLMWQLRRANPNIVEQKNMDTYVLVTEWNETLKHL
jgi:hypothetical protein